LDLPDRNVHPQCPSIRNATDSCLANDRRRCLRRDCRRSPESLPPQRTGSSTVRECRVMKRTAHLETNLLKSATSFHGHLGPYLILGLRMGLVAVRTLQPRGLHELSATIWTKQSPPESCLLDGIQVSSGCTLGKGNLRVKNASQVQARFRKGNRSILIKPTEVTTKLLLRISRRTTENGVKKLALSLSSMPERDLLVVKHGMRTWL